MLQLCSVCEVADNTGAKRAATQADDAEAEAKAAMEAAVAQFEEAKKAAREAHKRAAPKK